MTGKRKFEEQIAALDALRQAPADLRISSLRKSLANRNNFVVAKAADLTREFRLTELVPDLLSAFERSFENPEKSDPQCWAKNAISRSLAALEHQEPETFLRGMRHIQLEAVWGGRSDTAGTLRSTCALALVQCRTLNDTELLIHLTDLLGDKDKSVRVEAVRAIERVGSPAASLILRARAVLGGDDPEVLGASFSAILSLEGTRAIAWMNRFLAAGDDSSAEAALAIAATRSPNAFLCLKERLETASEAWWRSVLLSAIALTRQDAASDFLLDFIQSDSTDAERAIDAIVGAAPSSELLICVEKAVNGNPRLAHYFTTKNSSR